MPANARCLGTALIATCLGTSLAAAIAGSAMADERRSRLAIRVEVVARCEVSRDGQHALLDPACAAAAAPRVVVQDHAGLAVSTPAQVEAMGTDGVRYLTVIY